MRREASPPRALGPEVRTFGKEIFALTICTSLLVHHPPLFAFLDDHAAIAAEEAKGLTA